MEEAPDAEEGVEEATLSAERYAALGAREQFVLSISASGYGKRSSSYEYRVTGRGGSGMYSSITRSSSRIESYSGAFGSVEVLSSACKADPRFRCKVWPTRQQH